MQAEWWEWQEWPGLDEILMSQRKECDLSTKDKKSSSGRGGRWALWVTFFFFNLLLIGGELPYNVVLVSTE